MSLWVSFSTGFLKKRKGKGGCKECGSEKRFTTDEHVIGLENGKIVRTRNVRPKSVEDSW